MALFCRCGRHNAVLEKIELREVHLLFEILEESIEQTGLLTEIRDLLKGQQPGPGPEAKLIIPVGIPEEQ